MPEELSSIENHKALEADIERLRLEVEEVRSHSEARELSDREVLKAAIDRMAPEGGERYRPQTSPAIPQDDQNDDKSVLPGYAVQAPADIKLEVENLIDEAFHEGIAKAVGRARRSSPFVLDAFHDALSGELHEELKNRGLFK